MMNYKERVLASIENAPIESESSDGEDDQFSFLNKTRAQKRVSAPKIAQFNRLVDVDNLVENDHAGPIQEYEFLRDQQTSFEIDQKSKSMSFQLPTLEKSASFSHMLQSAVIEAPTDFLHVHVENSKFVPIKETGNDRANFLTDLRLSANARKTRHLDAKKIFEASNSELKQQARQAEAEDTDSEEETAKKVMDIIRLEEGEDADWDPEDVSDEDGDFKPDEKQEEEGDHDIDMDDEGNNDMGDESEDTESSSEEDSDLENKEDVEEPETPTKSDIPMDLEDSEASPVPIVDQSSPEKEQLDAIAAIMKTKQVERRTENIQVKQKRIRNKFFDEEAEEGSDNEHHDEVIKQAGNSDEEGLVEEDLEGLIDNEQQDGAEDKILEKHLNDEMMEDHLNLKRVIGGKFRERRGIGDYLDDIGTSETKRAQLINERATTLAEIQTAGFRKVKKNGSQGEEDEDSEDENLERFKHVQDVKAMRRVVTGVTSSSLELNDESVSYLDMLEHGAINSSQGSRRLAIDRQNSSSNTLERQNSYSSSNGFKESFMGKSFVFGREEFLSKNKGNELINSATL